MAPKSVTLDFTDVKDGSLHRRTRFPEGDYKGRILSVVDQLSSKDDTPMWVYTIEVKQGKKIGTYPFYCKIDPKNLWKVRSLFAAAGITIPKKRFQVDPNRIVGKPVGVTLEDDEYKDRINSTIAGVIPIADISDADDPEIDDQDDDDEDEDEEPVRPAKKRRAAPVVEPEDDEEGDEEEEPPAKPVTKKRRKVEPEPEEDEDSDDEEDEEPAPLPVKKRRPKPAPVEEPDDEDEDEEPVRPAKKTATKRASKKSRQISAVSDDELDELDIDDL